MTTNSELLDQAMSRLGQRSSTRLRADVLTEINTTITRLERAPFLPWFLEEDATLNIVAGDESKALPSNFLREASETRPYYTQEGTVYYLEKRLHGMLPGEDDATSLKFYAIRGELFYFRMVAEKSYTITVPIYAGQGPTLVDTSADVSNKWLLSAHDWTVNEALAKVAAFHIHSPEKASLLKGDATEAKRDIVNYHESRINENQDYFVGGSSDGS